MTARSDRAARIGAAARVVGAGLALGACAPVERPVSVPALRLVVSERWNGGTRLVLVEEGGDRWAVLSAARGGAPARDEQAVVSPDGRWVAFVSSRGRALDQTSLWVMPAAVGATAVRVTDGGGDDVDPTWTPAGDAVVFARRTGDRFALARVEIGGRADQPRIGAVEVVAAGRGHYLAPSVAPSGEIAYQEIDPRAGTSRIGVRAVDGSVTFATDGPRDVTPAWRPGSGELVFARSIDRADGGRDLDLWRLTADGDAASLADLPGTDESGPRWSRDGRWLFATALARDADGELPSVIYLDVAAPAPRPRMLRDRAGTIARQGPAPMPVALDDDALAGGPDYGAALAAALRERAYERELAAAQAAAAPDAGL